MLLSPLLGEGGGSKKNRYKRNRDEGVVFINILLQIKVLFDFFKLPTRFLKKLQLHVQIYSKLKYFLIILLGHFQTYFL